MKISRIFLCVLLTHFSLSIDSFGQNDFGITVFGTNQVTANQINGNFSNELVELRELYNGNREQYKVMKAQLTQKLEGLGKFGYTSIHLFKSYAGKFDFIIDFVDQEEVGTRLNYSRINYQLLDDPKNIIAKWIEYEDISMSLFREDEISDMSCPVIHCTWSFNHRKLKSFLVLFDEIAPLVKDELIQILNTSDSSDFRAASSFLLAHAKMDNAELLDVLAPSMHDPESSVRNNSMRVIYYIVRKYPDSQIDLSQVIEALDYPSFTDRNKALVILRSLPLDNLPKQNMERMVPILLEILEKKDAHNFRNAYLVLKKISEEEYPIDSIDKWKEWAIPYTR